MHWSVYVCACVCACAWVSWRWSRRRLLAMAEHIPGPPTLPLLGNALKFMCNPEEFIEEIKLLTLVYGDVLKIWLGPDLNVIVSNPDDLKTILSNLRMSVKGPQYTYMAEVLGGGILSGSGITWRKHRKIITPNYGKRAIESYSDVFNNEVDLLLEKLRIKDNQLIDIYTDIVRCTSYSVCQTLMGLSKEQTMNLPNIEEIIDKTPRLYDIIFDRMTKWFLQIDLIYWMTNRFQQQKHFVQITADFSRTILRHRSERLEHLEQKNLDLMDTDTDSIVNTQLSVIDRFILSQQLDKEELISETFTIFTSSQEASAKISSFIILMMAYHPKCQEKIYEEIISVIGDEDRRITNADLKQMPYLEMVFKEVLRLFPIGALLQRTIPEDVAISSCTIPAGCSMVVPIYHLHRDHRFWKNPDAFDPERFNPENTKKRNPNCYIPFSLGPMDCLGRYFGTKLIKTICVRVLREFEVSSPDTYDDLKVIISISVASVNGFPVILRPRKNNKNIA